MTLTELHSAHVGKVCDKWDHYLVAYDRIFEGYRSRPVDLLEVGIQNGGSLEIWAKYFAKGRHFIGCDINEKCRDLIFSDGRIDVVVGDAGAERTKSQIAARSKQFDIIIDDGSHTSPDIVKCFAGYFSLLRDGGIYIAEDLHCSYWLEYHGGLTYPLSAIGFFKRLVDVTNREAWGVPIPIGEALRDFSEAYSCSFDADLLEHVYSVEFCNSMCVVRKRAAMDGRLGRRRRAGTEALVRPEVLLEPDTLSVPDQGQNPSAVNPALPDARLAAETTAAHLDALRQLAQAHQEVQAMRASRIWRLTGPVRALKRLAGRFR